MAIYITQTITTDIIIINIIICICIFNFILRIIINLIFFFYNFI